MQDLPYDIWWLIASYLPVEEVKLLYSVNRSFFNISLDLRYPQVCMSTHPNEVVIGKDIRLFRNPLLSARPRTFSFILCSGNRKTAKIKNPILKALRWPLGSNKQPRLSAHLAELLEIVRDVVPRLTGVTTLDIIERHCGCSRPPPGPSRGDVRSEAGQLLISICEAFRNQLQSLKIETVLEYLDSLLSGSIRMPALETLSLQAARSHRHPEGVDEIIAQTLIPILTQHQSTLRNVTLLIDYYDYSLILPCLTNLHRLQNLELYLPPKATPFAGYDVLATHQANLRSLTLCYLSDPEQRSADSSFFSQDWCSVDLPRLRDLTVRMPRTSFHPEFADYIHRFASSLVSLTILDPPDFKYEDIKEFSSRLADFRSLQSLTVAIHGMSPANLAQFARALPHLRSLSLFYHYICPYKDNQHFNTSQLVVLYYQEMRRYAQLFSNWELESLVFAPAQTWSIIFGTDGSRNIDQRIRILYPLVNYLPNVRRFCQHGRDHLLGDDDEDLDDPGSETIIRRNARNMMDTVSG